LGISCTRSAEAIATGTSEGSPTGESDEAHRTRSGFAERGRNLQRGLRLADATASRKRYQPMLAHQRSDLVDLSTAANETGQRERQVRAGCIRPGADEDRGFGTVAQQHPARRGRLKLTGLRVTQGQRAGQERERSALRGAAIPALECAHSMRAQPGTFGEGFLREPRGEPEAPQKRPKFRWTA
jgi:hypothetical protein